VTYVRDPMLDRLFSIPQDQTYRALAARYAPLIWFDAREPFFPRAAGYTIFDRDGPSPSFAAGKEIVLAPPDKLAATRAIEYAIWWDWDIGHLYELEHVWVFIDRQGQVVGAEASWHGEWRDVGLGDHLPLQSDRVVLYSEPGKHAFAPTPDWFRERWQDHVRTETGFLAGVGGVLVARYFESEIEKSPLNDRLVHTYLSGHGFEPSWQFDTVFAFEPHTLVPWPALQEWIPHRVNHWLQRLRTEIPPSAYRVLRIGHRGARAYAPDNTLASFRKAAELGADVVEMDVQCTADGQLAVIHDPYLMAAESHLLPVQETALAELQGVDLGAGERVPTLESALAVCQQERMGAYIEIKDGRAVPGLASLLATSEWGGHCIVGSFRPDWLAEIKALAPEVTTSILFSSCHLDPTLLAASVDARFVHPCWERHSRPSQLLSEDWIERVRDARLGIIAWHEERLDEIAALYQRGIDGICSDAPELLLPGRPKGHPRDRT
jgi:glycerophosphoryl diester phosphodiesterase